LLTARELARSKKMAGIPELDSMGPYDHNQQRRWVGQDASLITWSMKSDTSFDHESKDPD
jgi:hypothetical protein